jgi:hypothetical protein
MDHLTRDARGTLQVEKSVTNSVITNKIPVITNSKALFNAASEDKGLNHNLVAKRDLILIGDENVRGLGQMIQDHDVNGHVIVRAGQGFKAAENQVAHDIATMNDNATFVLGFGTVDIGQRSMDETKRSITRVIQKCDQAGKRVNLGLIKVPPQRLRLRQQNANDLNNFLVEMARKTGSRVHILDCNFNTNDTGINGMFCNYQGKQKMASEMKRFIRQAAGSIPVPPNHMVTSPRAQRLGFKPSHKNSADKSLPLTICSLNANGMSEAKSDYLQDLVKSYDIVVIQETWNTANRKIEMIDATVFMSFDKACIKIL